MSDTPETDAAWAVESGNGLNEVKEISRKLERERDEARKQAAMWKANHDNQVALKAMLMERPDLGDRASRIAQLIQERDEARQAFSELWQYADALLPEIDEETLNRWNKCIKLY